MAWKIVNDYINDAETTRIGRASGELTGKTYRFRLLDDDGEVYYGGLADAGAAENDEDSGGLYTALRWAAADAGCTDLQLHPSDALEYHLTSSSYIDAHPEVLKTRWVSIYG